MPLHHRLLSKQLGRQLGPSIGPADRDRPGARLILAHGFTQNADCWGRFGAELAGGTEPVGDDVVVGDAEPGGDGDGEPGGDAEVVAVDGPGHGRSGHDEADLWEAARLHVEAAGSGVHVGYSMGGRMALHAALAHPERVTGLVLIGATAGIDDPAARAERRAADDALADGLLADGLPLFLDRWLAGPLFAHLTDEQSARRERLTNRAEGLAASLRNCGTGSQEPLWDRLGSLTMPVLVIAGASDHKFTALGRRLVAAMTGTTADLVGIPGGHAVHLEQPERTAAAVKTWLAAVDRAGRS